MLDLPKNIRIAEVGPRDGLQGFARWVDTADKVRIIDRLSETGLPIIEVSSFTSPRVVPFLQDAEEVFSRIRRKPGVVYRGLVPNARGAERAAKAGVGEMLGLLTVSATYTRKNQNMDMQQVVEQALLSFRVAERAGIPFLMALGMAFWCAYEGLIAEDEVMAIVARLHAGGIRRYYLAGSLGMEDPVHVNRLFRRLIERFPDAQFGYHVHNLSGMATANVLAALDAGVTWLESAICGIGGGIAMPAALGAIGNYPTEDLIGMLAEMQVETGVDSDDIIAASIEIAGILGIEPRSHRASGATRPQVMQSSRHGANVYS
ncbi:hydroxymethylglutaryl-CoA lyase [Variovorax sp. GB1P17]|uniref:hydroxymethylglutaryl-CoA lyase n=1 Tax=Variovorax sp. GB1P17 TaxID=3443740 RepID=UPI003F478A1F